MWLSLDSDSGGSVSGWWVYRWKISRENQYMADGSWSLSASSRVHCPNPVLFYFILGVLPFAPQKPDRETYSLIILIKRKKWYGNGHPPSPISKKTRTKMRLSHLSFIGHFFPPNPTLFFSGLSPACCFVCTVPEGCHMWSIGFAHSAQERRAPPCFMPRDPQP